MTLVDRAVRRLLRTLFAHRFFDRAGFVDDDSRVDKAAHLASARRLAERGTTLLKNDGALPLDGGRLRSLAVIGAEADTYKSGHGSSTVRPIRTSRRGRASSPCAVRASRFATTPATCRCGRPPSRAAPTPRWWSWPTPPAKARTSPAWRWTAAAGSPLERDELIEAVAAVNPRTIVVLETGGPVLTPWRDRVEAIVEAWYPGSAGRHRDSAGPVRRRRPGRAPASDLPAPRGRPADGGRSARLPRREGRGGLLRPRARGLQVVRRAPHPARISVRLRPLLYALRVPRPAGAAGSQPHRCARLRRGGQQGRPHRDRGPAALPGPAGSARPVAQPPRQLRGFES